MGKEPDGAARSIGGGRRADAVLSAVKLNTTSRGKRGATAQQDT
jgi:hypothetical protein